MIWRPNTNGRRVFPLPKEAIESAPSPWFNRRSSPFRLLKPRSPVAKLRGFFWLYRAALLAETQRQKFRATFYWKEAGIIAKIFTRKPKILSAALNSLAPADSPTETAQTDDLISRFVSETLIDGLAAAYNALDAVDDARAQQHRDFHVALIAQWLPFTSLTPQEKLAFLRPAIRRSANAAAESKRWKDMVESYRLALP